MIMQLIPLLGLSRSTFTGWLAGPFLDLPALLLVGVLLGVTTTASAHDANFAAIKIIRQPTNTWTFELQTPLEGLDQSMRQFNEERARDLGDLTAGNTRYKELIVEYVKATFELDSNIVGDDESPSPKAVLGPGRIKLGDHVSVLIFNIENMPDEVSDLTLRMPFMASNPGQHNILWLIDGERSQRYVLNADNEFTVVDAEFYDS